MYAVVYGDDRAAVCPFRGQKIQTSVERMFRIWKERRVYDNTFLKELEQLIEPTRKPDVAATKAAPSFKVSIVDINSSCWMT